MDISSITDDQLNNLIIIAKAEREKRAKIAQQMEKKNYAYKELRKLFDTNKELLEFVKEKTSS
jgi:hypothetical protein